MQQSFPEHYEAIAESMGITLYQRFSINEASLFLRCQVSEVSDLIHAEKLDCIKVTETEFQFFGFQLLEYLLENVTGKRIPAVNANDLPERIIRAKEVGELTGLSRTTLWRMEKSGKFPNRVSLGVGSVGWRFSEVGEWVKKRNIVD